MRHGDAPIRLHRGDVVGLRGCVSVSARAIRAYGGHDVMAMAITAFPMPGPSAATKASARIRRGNARKMSVMRISAASTSPPA